MSYNPTPSGPMSTPYPHLPPAGSDIPMQPMAYPNQPPYNPNYAQQPVQQQPPYPNQYPMQQTPYNNSMGFANPDQQPPGPPMMGQQFPYNMPQQPGVGAPGYNYPQTNYVVVPQQDGNQQRRDSDGGCMDCCRCMLCCLGCVELCRCLGGCLTCLCDSDD